MAFLAKSRMWNVKGDGPPMKEGPKKEKSPFN